MSAPSAGALSAVWSQPIMISTDEALDVALDGDSIYVDGRSHLTTSHDLGATWNSVPGIFSRICADDGIIYRVSGLGEFYGPTIWFDMSSDDGSTWSEPVPILALEGSNDASFGVFKFDSRLVFYTLDGQPGGNEFGAMVKVAWSDDEGATWSAPVIVDQGLYVEDPFANDIVRANGVLYMTYYDQTQGFDVVEVIVAKSPDMGATWTNAVVSIAPHAFNPIITVDSASGELYVAYFSAIVLPDWTLVDAGPYVVKSLDGISWSVPVKAGAFAASTDPSGFHSLAASDGMVFEAYLNYTRTDAGGIYKVKISCSMDDGATWSDMGDVTGLDSNAIYPIMAITQSRLHFFWSDYGAGNPWYDAGSTYYRSMPIGVTVFGEATVTRSTSGNPAKDAKTISFAPEKDGQLWVSAVSSKLTLLKVDVYTKGVGRPTLVSTQYLVFGRDPGPAVSGMVKVVAGHEYTVKLTPYGMPCSSAQVTGLFVAG